ncbi:MAG: hypothetical protein OHK006_04370 [Thermodesulfovibrionales bacterium]
MHILRIVFLSVVSLGLVFSFAFAKHHTPEERGKTLFNDKKFAGGSKACNDCHANGRGIEKAPGKKEFKLMGKTAKSLEEVVNICIVSGNGGKAIDVKSEQMKDIIAYIKSLDRPKTDKPANKPAGGY